MLLFEMCCGWSPFYAEDTQTMYKNICFGKIRFPKGVIGEEGKQFVKGVSILVYQALLLFTRLFRSCLIETRNIVLGLNATLPS